MKLNIGAKITLLVLGVALLALIAAEAGTAYQLLKVRDDVSGIVSETSGGVVKKLEQAATRRATIHLTDVVDDGRRFVDMRLSRIRNYVNMMADVMTGIYSLPSLHAEWQIAPPRRDNREVVAQLLFAPGVEETEPLRREIARAAGGQEYFLSLLKNDPLVNVGTIASENGFTIDIDGVSYLKFNRDGVIPFEARERPWYRIARERGEFAFTGVFDDLHHGEKVVVGAAPFFRNGEFAGVVALGCLLTDLRRMVRETNIGESGYGAIINSKGEVIIGRDDENRDVGKILLDPSLFAGKNDGLIRTSVDGQDVYFAYAPLSLSDWIFAALIDGEEIVGTAHEVRDNMNAMGAETAMAVRNSITNALKVTVLVLLVVVAFTVVLSRMLARRLATPLGLLTKAASTLSGGDFDVKVDIHSGDEIEELSHSFNKMGEDLRRYMDNLTRTTAEKERIAAELNVARDIQASMLPSIFPAFPEREDIDLYAKMAPAKEVGGDLYDFFLVDEDRVCVVIADVCDKGVPAALFMVVVKTLIKNQAQAGLSPKEIAASVNDMLCENNPSNMFATAFLAIYDTKTRRLSYTNAGHNFPFVSLGGGAWHELEPSDNGLFLGGLLGAPYSQDEIDMPAGSLLFLYTDGVTEAFNEREEQFSEERLLDLLSSRLRDNPSSMEAVIAVEDAVVAFAGAHEQSDDRTMLVLKTL